MSTATRPNLDGSARAAQWNAEHPVGTYVSYWPAERGDNTTPYLSRTRSEAWALAGVGAAVVSVEGYAGGIALTHVEPLSADNVVALEQGVTWDQFSPDEWDGYPYFAGDTRDGVA